MINPIQDAVHFKDFRNNKEAIIAKLISKNSVHLPSSSNLKRKDIQYICSNLIKFFK